MSFVPGPVFRILQDWREKDVDSGRCTFSYCSFAIMFPTPPFNRDFDVEELCTFFMF